MCPATTTVDPSGCQQKNALPLQKKYESEKANPTSIPRSIQNNNPPLPSNRNRHSTDSFQIARFFSNGYTPIDAQSIETHDIAGSAITPTIENEPEMRKRDALQAFDKLLSMVLDGQYKKLPGFEQCKQSLDNFAGKLKNLQTQNIFEDCINDIYPNDLNAAEREELLVFRLGEIGKVFESLSILVRHVNSIIESRDKQLNSAETKIAITLFLSILTLSGITLSVLGFPIAVACSVGSVSVGAAITIANSLKEKELQCWRDLKDALDSLQKNSPAKEEKMVLSALNNYVKITNERFEKLENTIQERFERLENAIQNSSKNEPLNKGSEAPKQQEIKSTNGNVTESSTVLIPKTV